MAGRPQQHDSIWQGQGQAEAALTASDAAVFTVDEHTCQSLCSPKGNEARYLPPTQCVVECPGWLDPAHRSCCLCLNVKHSKESVSSSILSCQRVKIDLGLGALQSSKLLGLLM